MVPSNSHKKFRLLVSGEEIGDDFHPHGLTMAPKLPGLYMLEMNTNGTIVDRQFARPADTAEVKQPSSKANSMVVIWRPDAQGTPPPDWLQQLGVDGRGGTWIYRLTAGTTPRLEEHISLGQSFVLSRQACMSLLR
jgi:hypothetical protein